MMRKHLRYKISDFGIWLVFLNLLTSTAADGFVSYNLVDRPGIFTFVVVIKSSAGVCTGTIVSQDYVLTAAHCLYKDGKLMSTGDVTVLAGITDYVYPQEGSQQARGAAEFHVHPRFWYNRLAKFDIGLVKVNESFTFNQWVGRINISGDGWTRAQQTPDNCMSLGFGGHQGDTSDVKYLKVWNVTAAYGKENCPCSRRFQWRRLLCAKNTDYAKLCQGDDGGPLVCGNEVRGLAHMIRNWYRCREDPRYPLYNCAASPDRGLSIYMLLCPFNDWLHGVVPEIPPTPAYCSASRPAAAALLLLAVLSRHLAK